LQINPGLGPEAFVLPIPKPAEFPDPRVEASGQ
jgi:hypothetical protein